MTLEDAKTIVLYFLFNAEGLSFKDNSDAFVEANKVLETETRNILRLRQWHKEHD